VKATAYIIGKRSDAFDTMVLSKTIAKDILNILAFYFEKARVEKSKEHLHKLTIYMGIIKLLDTPLSELKITWIKQSLGLLSNWIISDG
jgi:hypothetical protein